MYSLPNIMSDSLALNEQYFMKMAHGDVPGFIKMAEDYFSDTRRLLKSWPSMIADKQYSQLRDELHRCKGGASLFGCERLLKLLADRETPEKLEQLGFDFPVFESELDSCEQALIAMSRSKV